MRAGRAEVRVLPESSQAVWGGGRRSVHCDDFGEALSWALSKLYLLDSSHYPDEVETSADEGTKAQRGQGV